MENPLKSLFVVSRLNYAIANPSQSAKGTVLAEIGEGKAEFRLDDEKRKGNN